ncbi:unnamed protein product [Ceutorhynchus assimilis]|uniref:Uncharacterized protein n=1 Tax=Ceutorhynchus assimilis TaxID=467358 RepID=A0A9N9QKA7_9CUCU|nr:unnamed protein product [Ceutorhynchus assimilis]
MSFKLDVDRLAKDELMYEVKCRGIKVSDTDNVDSLRKNLRSALLVEKNASFTQPFSFTGIIGDELVICESNLDEIGTSLAAFSSEIRKLETKICHCYNRLENILTDDADLIGKRSSLIKTLMELIDDYKTKSKSLQSEERGFQELIASILTGSHHIAFK